jgi:hypothetical protein
LEKNGEWLPMLASFINFMVGKKYTFSHRCEYSGVKKHVQQPKTGSYSSPLPRAN